MKLTEQLVKYLPLGYLYLIILGIIKESIFHYQIGIKILKFSSLTDILLSPISDITSEPITLIFLLVYFLFLFFFVYRRRNSPSIKKHFLSSKKVKNLSPEDYEKLVNRTMIGYVFVGLFLFFSGLGFGSGAQMNKRIKNQTLSYRNTISLISDTATHEIHIITINSQYCFYVEKGTTKVQVAPLTAIKTIEFTKNSKLDGDKEE